jgi:Xaa-Pro aminopeptidase
MAIALYHSRLEELRASLREAGVEGFVLSVNDEFFSEYPPEHFKRLEWLTGFTGSAGMAVVLQDKAAFFTDGRYTLQAADQVNAKDYAIYNSRDVSPVSWIAEQAQEKVMGVDPWLVSAQQMGQWRSKAPGVKWKALDANPIDRRWKDRPTLSTKSAFDYPLSLAGVSREDKITAVAHELQQKKLDAVLLSLPESVCWLLNIRGRDMQYTPLLLCRAMVTVDGRVALFVPAEKISETLKTAFGKSVEVCAPESILKACASLKGKRVGVTPGQTNLALYHALEQAGAMIENTEDPCTVPKACKNPVEQQSIREVHRRDGKALTEFLQWVESRVQSSEFSKGELTELSSATQLDEKRKQQEGFIEPSFPTISGFGSNGAIVHYRATETSNKRFEAGNLYLVDSGGQYWGGTTDVTRTVAIGEPTAEMRECFTRVLKGHIALARVVFPRGTTGSQLDALARQFLWEAGLDYDHGTGHGVGCCLGVHEGPQRISKLANEVALQPGMVVSNEPGYYKTGAFGIRIENLVMVQESEKQGFLCFETLTCAPIDTTLVETSLMTQGEIDWLNAYHHWVSEVTGYKAPRL